MPNWKYTISAEKNPSKFLFYPDSQALMTTISLDSGFCCRFRNLATYPFSPCSQYVFCTGTNNCVRYFRISETKKCLHLFRHEACVYEGVPDWVRSDQTGIRSAVWTKDQLLITGGSDGKVWYTALSAIKLIVAVTDMGSVYSTSCAGNGQANRQLRHPRRRNLRNCNIW